MILVDTSVIIDFLKGYAYPQVEKLDEVIASSISYGIADITYQEVLQGAASLRDLETLKSYMDTIPLYSPLHGRESFAQAAMIYFNCRHNGYTIRSTIDCLIAQISIEHGLRLLHNDKDFDHMSKIVPELEIL